MRAATVCVVFPDVSHSVVRLSVAAIGAVRVGYVLSFGHEAACAGRVKAAGVWVFRGRVAQTYLPPLGAGCVPHRWLRVLTMMSPRPFSVSGSGGGWSCGGG